MRVLIAGTNRACHHRLREQGHELVLFVPRDKAKPEDLTGPYEHVVALAPDATPALWVDAARLCGPFDAVVAFNEGTYRIVHEISTRLGIPSTVDIELYERVRDKVTTRDVVAREGIASCRYVLARGADEVRAAVSEIGPPCIVKPVDAEGSLGVAKVVGPDGVPAALDRLGAERVERGVLVEEFLSGEEYSVEALSVGDQHRIVAVTQKFSDPRTFVEKGHLVPAPLAPDVRAAVEKYTVAALRALGFHDCPSHTEIIVTPEGPRLVETHNRIGGDRIIDLVEHATGVDLYDLVARQSIGEDIGALLPERIGVRQSAAVWYADPGAPPTHTLVEVGNVGMVRDLPYVRTVDVLRQPGSRQDGEVRTSFDRSALVVAVADEPGEAVRRARQAIGTLRFTYLWEPSPHQP
jgi:biotin carboxylase